MESQSQIQPCPQINRKSLILKKKKKKSYNHATRQGQFLNLTNRLFFRIYVHTLSIADPSRSYPKWWFKKSSLAPMLEWLRICHQDGGFNKWKPQLMEWLRVCHTDVCPGIAKQKLQLLLLFDHRFQGTDACAAPILPANTTLAQQLVCVHCSSQFSS